MGKQRELRLLRRARASERELSDVRPIVRAAERYVAEIYAPNIKEPFSVVNRRSDLVEAVNAARIRRGLRSHREWRAAPNLRRKAA